MFLALRSGLLLAIASILAMASLAAQDESNSEINREYRIKAAYLYQFGRYVEWPDKTFPSPETPFTIGILDQDPVAADLDHIAQIKKIQDRPIQIRRFSSANDIRACNILYLSSMLEPETQAEAMRRVAGKGILLVGDADGFLARGGVIQFILEGNRIRVVISRKAAEREGLKISAKLLQVARIVD